MYVITLVDDWGRYDGDPALLKAECFPYDEDVRMPDFETWLESLVKADALLHYQVDGKWYVQVQRWTERKRSNTSRYPDPPCAAQRSAAERSNKRAGPNGAGAGADDGDGGEEGVQGEMPSPLEMTAALFAEREKSGAPPPGPPVDETDQPFSSGGGFTGKVSPLVAVLEKLGMSRIRQSGWPGIAVTRWLEENGGDVEGVRRLEAAAADGMVTWKEATAWCQEQDWNKARVVVRGGNGHERATTNGAGTGVDHAGADRGGGKRSKRAGREYAEPDADVPTWSPSRPA